MTRKYILLTSILLLLVIFVACVPVFSQPIEESSTQTLFHNEVVQTLTARAVQQGSSGHELATSFANATALSQTITSQALLKNASYPVTATAIFPALEELQHYGVSPFDGEVAWLHRPVTISVNGINQFGYANDYPQVTAGNFVLASDITWNTNYGLSGCGFMFRSDGNSQAPNQLMVLLSRVAEGTLAFSALAGGNITNMNYFYPWIKDKSFNWQNNSTNRLVIIVRANLIDIYTNGVLIAEVDTSKPPPSTFTSVTIPQLPSNPSAQQLLTYQQIVNQYQLDSTQLSAQLSQAQQNYYSNKISSLTDGFLGFAVSSSSGTAGCKFSNAWLFLFNQPPTPTPTITPTFNGTPYTSTPTLTQTLTPIFKFYLTPSFTNTSVRGAPPSANPPTDTPTAAPTVAPTAAPTSAPTATAVPTVATTVAPTATQPPVPTATQPPPPTATQPPVPTNTP